MDLATAFLLPLLGGYCFAYLWRPISFATKLAEGNHLYFRAAVCGVMLFALALCIRNLLAVNFPAYLHFDSALVEYVSPVLKMESGLEWETRAHRAEWVVTAVYSLALGIAFGAFANVFTPRHWALGRGLSTLDRLLLRPYLENIQLSLTLETAKVYVGSVADYPNPTLEPVAVTFLPLFSGNRDAAGQLTLTTDYDAIYSTLEAGRARQIGLPADWRSDIELQIRADEIVTAAIFSIEIYAEFNPTWKQRISQPNTIRR